MSVGANPEAAAGLLDALPDAILFFGLDDRVLFANAAYRDLFGYSDEELLGADLEQLLPPRARNPELRGRRIRALAAMPTEAVGSTFDMGAAHRDGRELPLEVQLTWAELDGAQVAVARARRIDDRDRTAVAQRLAAVVYSSPNAIFTKTLEGTITSWNRGAQRMYNYLPEEVIGRPVSILMDAERAHEMAEILEEIRQGRTVESLETQRIAKDGRRIDVSVSVSPIRDSEGTVIGAATVAHDITERKRGDERIRALLESAPDAVVVISEAGDIVFVNRRTEELFGYERDEMLGQPVTMLVSALGGQEPAYLRVLAGDDAPVERDGRRADGSEFPIEVTFSPLTTDEGVLVFASVRDVTARKLIEAELRRSNHDLEQFAYVASHDLSEPLRVIAGFVDLLARRYRGRLDEDADRFIDFTVAGVERMQALIDDLLAYSRAGRVHIELREVDAQAVVSDVLWGLEPQIAQRGVTVEVGPLPTVRAEKALLRQIFQNLLANAVKFCDGDAPQVQVSAERARGGWRFDVRDNGPGVDPRYAERVFELFQRLHGREVPGSGMGLAIVKRLAERHGGHVWVTPAQPRGSVFSFTLPDRQLGL